MTTASILLPAARRCRRGRRRRAPVLATSLVLAAALAGCSGGGSVSASSDNTASIPAALDPSLATSLSGGGGTWATVAMGHLSQPLNTFWQLLFLPAGGHSWSDQVQATAVATNGGIVLASSPGGTLVAGVRPSNRLTFSPLVVTSDAGGSWSNGVLDAGLLDRPDAMAGAGPTQGFALVTGSKGSRLLRSAGSLDDWQTVADQTQLARGAAGLACGLNALTAVADFAGEPVVGTACSRAGVVGMMVPAAGGWQLAGPALPSSLRGWRSDVLSLSADAGGLGALVGLWRDGDVQLVAAFSANGRNWQLSAPLALGRGHTVSVGPVGGTGVFALTSDGQGDTLEVDDGPGSGWTQLPSPPSRTATVAFSTTTAPAALAVDGSVLTVWTLEAQTWSRSQTMDVPIAYGSSS